MKIKNIKFKIIAIIVFSLFFTNNSFAQNASSPSANQALIEKLTTEIASQTAQKKLVEKRGIVGYVTDSTSGQIVISDLNEDIRYIDVDELTKFYSSSDKSFGISDVKNNMFIGAIGLFNKDSKRLLARKIDQISPFPMVIYGAITKVDSENFELTISTEENKKIIVIVSDLTKTNSFFQGVVEKSGFSKIEAPQSVVLTGFKDKQSKEKILATEITLLPDIRINNNIDLTPIIPSATDSAEKKVEN